MPARFQGVPLGYVATTQEAQREAAFYAGEYDHTIPEADYTYQDTVTDGEIAGLGFILQPSVGFCNPVLIVTGVDDAIFCTAPLASCKTVLNSSRQFFPDSTNFQYAAIPATGHCLTLHYSAPATFARVHVFLDEVFSSQSREQALLDNPTDVSAKHCAYACSKGTRTTWPPKPPPTWLQDL
jgi:hypothetical protein